jgi:hypothetical protein
VAAAAQRLELSRGHNEGEHQLCCGKGCCLKCEQIYLRTEADLRPALLKVTPRPSHMTGDKSPHPQLGSEAPSVPTLRCERGVRSGITEYLRKFFSGFEDRKPLEVWSVSQGISFRDDRAYVFVSVTCEWSGRPRMT